jgi:HlyD family secretion protein
VVLSKKGWIGAGVAVVVVGALAVYQFRGTATPAKGEAPPESVAAPVKADNKVVVEGHVVPVRSATLTFPSGGVVAEVLVKEGQAVKAGQVIARLQAGNQRAALAQAQAQHQRALARLNELRAGPRPEEIASAKAGVEAAEARLAQVKRGADPEEVDAAAVEVNRAQERLAAALRTGRQVEIDQAQAALSAAEERLVKLSRGAREEEIAAAEAEVRRAQAQLELLKAGQRPEAVAVAEADVAAAQHGVEQAQEALSLTELKAPIDATVVVLDLKVGEVASPGNPVVRLADLSEWEIVTDDLTELSVAKIREGAAATIRFDAIPDLELTGKVSKIRMWGEKKQGDLTFVATIRPDRLDERLRWNMTASVTIQGQ